MFHMKHVEQYESTIYCEARSVWIHKKWKFYTKVCATKGLHRWRWMYNKNTRKGCEYEPF